MDLNDDFGPALVRAAANGASTEVAYLLSIGVDPDYRNQHEPWDIPAIVRAASHFDIVDLLLEAGADPNGGELPFVWSLLFPAASAVDAERTRQFLEMGIDPHLQGELGNALSMAACGTARSGVPSREAKDRTHDVVKLLLAEDVNPDVHFDGRSPLRCAEHNQNAELAKTLTLAGAHSHESLWNRVKRGVAGAGYVVLTWLGGGV